MISLSSICKDGKSKTCVKASYTDGDFGRLDL